MAEPWEKFGEALSEPTGCPDLGGVCVCVKDLSKQDGTLGRAWGCAVLLPCCRDPTRPPSPLSEAL